VKPRVKRGPGPAKTMTKATYRKKALLHLLKDFEKRCAYCLDPNDFRHPSQDHVDHFDCKLPERKRHQYRNLMLACATCNQCKHDKPVVNAYSAKQRLLNCTEESEFSVHIVEGDDGQWTEVTEAGKYHLASIGLKEECHRKKRAERRRLAQTILNLCSTAISYKSQNPVATHNALIDTIKVILAHLDNFPPLILGSEVLSVREWLTRNGVTLPD